ncbi:MAG: hypothetical protein NT070_09570 [Cyanobacteria bacterium]|nr:hypothetical protein [Cyanobacteriota bacterium]
MNAILEQIQRHATALPLSSQAELLNYAVYLEQKARQKMLVTSNQARREGLAQALAQAVALNPFAEIADPVAWQREQRQDRALVGRNDAD